MAINSGDKQMALKLQNEFTTTNTNGLKLFYGLLTKCQSKMSELLKHQSYFLKVDLYKLK